MKLLYNFFTLIYNSSDKRLDTLMFATFTKKAQTLKKIWAFKIGTEGGARTLTLLLAQDFESCVSTNSTTSASIKF